MVNNDKGARIKQTLAQSTYITAAWNWFMILAGKAAEPMLVASQTTIFAGRVGRSRKRWKVAQAVSVRAETDDQPGAVLVGE